MRVRMFDQSIRLWSARIHRHLGLALGPFVLIFATSMLIFNHLSGSEIASEPQVRTIANLEIPDLEGLPLARALLTEIGLDGEVDWVQKRPEENEILILLSTPARRTEVRVDAEARSARVETRRLSPLDRILYLHKRPGPHVASIRGNWWFMKIWRYGADFSVIGVLLLSLTGIYLWWRMPGERKLGLICLVLGVVVLNGLFILMLR